MSAETLEIAPAPIGRPWIDDTDARFAARCLPLLVANQAGWVNTSCSEVRATWNGAPSADSIVVDAPGFGARVCPAVSHFGHGILTWTIPWLFRTPPGWDLLVRGPANWPVPGAYPLEGIVQTDWTPATFTMNWRLTAAVEVVFPANEPIGMLVPQQRGVLESFVPNLAPISTDPAESADHLRWSGSRRRFNDELSIPGSDANRRRWQRDYLLGARQPASGGARRRPRLRPFEKYEAT